MANFIHLRKRAQFLLVAREGRKFVTPNLVAQILPHPERVSSGRLSSEGRAGNGQAGTGNIGSGVIQVGFTVTKKVGNAVIRNRTRRRLREAVRLVGVEQSAALTGLSGDLVFIGRASTRLCPFAVLQEEVGRVFQVMKKNASGSSAQKTVKR